MNRDPSHCLNCDFELGNRFCPNCGQKAATGRMTIRGTIEDFIDKYFDFESGFLHTFIQMCLSPGAVIRRYVEGHRKEYVNPLTYALFGTAVSTVLFWYIGDSPEAMRELFQGTAAQLSLEGAKAEKFVEMQIGMIQYLSISTALTCIPFAILLRLMFFRRENNLAELFAFSMYVMGHVFMVDLATAPIQFFLNFQINSWITLSIYLLVAVHATIGFFGGTFWSIFRVLAAFAISMFGVQTSVTFIQLVMAMRA